MSLTDNRRKKRGVQTASTSTGPQSSVAEQVTSNRRTEILEYLSLFGYNPDRTILQVHITGFFNRQRADTKAIERRERSAKRYGGRTFVIVGRTHDPSITNLVSKPKKKTEATSSGYVGYLWKNKDLNRRAPHELLPLDFTPSHVPYPEDWKNMFATKGFMIALHVQASFAKDKNKLLRAIYRAGKKVDVRQPWGFLKEVRESGYGHQPANEDPLNILKIRLAKGEINQEDYERLRQVLIM